MTGKVSGVATRLGRCNPYLIVCYSQTSTSLCPGMRESALVQKCFIHYMLLFCFFFQASAVRIVVYTAGLKEIQDILDTQGIYAGCPMITEYRLCTGVCQQF